MWDHRQSISLSNICAPGCTPLPSSWGYPQVQGFSCKPQGDATWSCESDKNIALALVWASSSPRSYGRNSSYHLVRAVPKSHELCHGSGHIVTRTPQVVRQGISKRLDCGRKHPLIEASGCCCLSLERNHQRLEPREGGNKYDTSQGLSQLCQRKGDIPKPYGVCY